VKEAVQEAATASEAPATPAVNEAASPAAGEAATLAAGGPEPSSTAVDTTQEPPADGREPEPAPAPAPPSLSGSVVDFDTDIHIVVIDLGKSRGVRLGRVGRVLDDNGQTLVRFVISELLPDFSVGKIVEGDDSKLRQGLKVELKSGGEG
jgi:hypothetical protein